MNEKSHDKNARKLAKAVYSKNATPAGFIKHDKFSDRRSKVYQDSSNGDVYISYRGTDIFNKNDLLADAAILTGTERHSGRFKEAVDKFKKVKDHFDKPIILTGHSLGGRTSTFVGAKKKATEVHAYNAGSNPLIDFARRNQKVKTKTTEYSTGNDLISLGTYVKKNNTKQVFVKNKKNTTAHSVDNFV